MDNGEKLVTSTWEELIASRNEVDRAVLPSVRQALWDKYRSSFKCQASQELSSRTLCEKMKMWYDVTGGKPPEGYPLYICLHGGGGAPTSTNDSQWKDMQKYYLDSVSTGVYVAPRGITDTWNLHFVKESYTLYDRLIAYMILCHNVDPNRVYLLGFSAGGDAVYQVTPRMADRWAAASMSSGHPNGIRMDNLYHVPFVIQVGERDHAYDRCAVGIKYGVKLSDLQKLYPDGYIHECWVHLNKGHNFKDNDQQQRPYMIACNPKSKGDYSKTVKQNTNAVAWVSQHRRNPVPSHVIWDVGTRATRHPLHPIEGVTAPSDLFYWIGIRNPRRSTESDATYIEATLDRDSNTIHIREEGCGSYICILINDHMLDTRSEVKVTIGVQEFMIKVRPSLATMARTLLERGDPNFMFESEICLSRHVSESVQWEISGTLAR